ncbi:MAG TPA: hypothetical protein VHK47_13765 [Polyangia bacterium]|jgi:MYXO-CTERM domain-containing protein|nr:hypothetical protein [Polyangia bacterium]
MIPPRPSEGRGVFRARRPPRVAAALALALALSGPAAPRAQAYVRYKTKSGTPFFWAQTWIPVFAYPASMKDASGHMDMTSDEIMHAAAGAADAWSGSSNSCTFLEINVTAHAEAPPSTKLDWNNILIFEPANWCGPKDKAGKCTYPREALAITSVFNSKSSGQILDADIEVNATFAWADLEKMPGDGTRQDLQNALTHEMGHLIGLDHTCFPAAAAGDPPVDQNGAPVPFCENAPPDVQATTMFASAIPGDIAKRTLAPDDVQAVCDIYPLAEDPMVYPVKDQPPDQGCALGPVPRGEGPGAALAALGVLAFAARRRRRSR